jgi:hypothetical protein
MVEGGELQAQKQCGSKNPLTTLHSRAQIASNPKAMRGSPLGLSLIPALMKDQLMKKEWWLKLQLTP